VARTWTTFRLGLFRDRIFSLRVVSRGHRQTGQLGNRERLIVQADMRVTHRHPDITVTSQLASLNQRGAATKQLRDVGVPTCGMKVSDTLRRLVSNSHSFQIELDHPPGAALLKQRKQWLISSQTDQPLLEHSDKFGVQRQDVFSTVLRASRLDRDHGLSDIEAKTRRGETCQLATA
jgi:hypothetical protein